MTATLTPPVPIVLIGIHAEIGGPVAEGLRPDWDIVRFIQTFEAAKEDLPHLLAGRAPPNPPANSVGSGSYGRPARAVLFGRGFSQQQAETLRGLFGAGSPAAWIASDEAGRPPLSELPPGAEKIMVPVFRDALEKWKKEGAAEGRLILY